MNASRAHLYIPSILSVRSVGVPQLHAKCLQFLKDLRAKSGATCAVVGFLRSLANTTTSLV
jgi:hypothetical protein